MKLLLVINRLTPAGGAETQLTHLARGFAANGHEVTVCCVDGSMVPPGTLENDGIRLVELGIRAREGRVRAIAPIARLARGADLVHCTMWDSSLWGRIGAALARRPVVVADHATDRSVQIAASGAPRERWIALHNRALDRFTAATVACATSQRPILIGEGVDPDKIVYIPNGVPAEALARQAAAGPSRADLGLPEGAPLAMQVGVFRAEKNQAGGIEAFAKVRERVPDAELVLVGDGPLREEVEAGAERIGADKWAHFLGQRSDVPALLALADLQLLPSLADAMPMTILESMAVGVPILATDVGDVRSTVGDAGSIVPAADAEALAAECARMLSDPQLLERYGAAGRARIGEFDAAAMVRRYEALFAAAIAGGAPVAAVEALA